MIVWGAVQYMTASGDQAKAKSGLKVIYNALLALALYLGMLAILNFVVPSGDYTV